MHPFPNHRPTSPQRCRPWRQLRLRLPAIAPLMAAALVAAGCDSGIAGPGTEAGNVAFQLDAAVMETDTGVFVDGRAVVSHPYNGRALWLARYNQYALLGFPELDYPQSTFRSDAWRFYLMHEYPREPGDSLIFRFADHGEATLAGVAMTRHTDTPHFSAGLPIRFENFLRYGLQSSIHIQWAHGDITHQEAPFHSAVVGGQELLLQTSGSAEVEPVTARFAAPALASLTGITNGDAVPLDDAAPTIRVARALGLEFNRPLDPERAFIALFPFTRGSATTARRAFIQPRQAAQRVVIPAESLDTLLGGSGGQRQAYVLIIVEFDTQPDVLRGSFTGGGEFALPFVHRSETVVHLYLERN
jgi:hypothetical protein